MHRPLIGISLVWALSAACGPGRPASSADEGLGPAPTASVAPILVESSVRSAPETTPPIAGPRLDREIAAMVTSVDGQRMFADVRRLAEFGTRHSLSDTKSETRGIGAAARWLKKRFDEVAPSAKGRLDVRLHDYVAPKGPRVPKPWPMQNVVATLRGTATGPAARAIVISGHLDSRASDVMNATIDAPGANDDASGVSVVLEACRALAPYSFEATVVFAAVTGEEQGLFGSAALQQKLAAEGMRVEAMLTNDIVGASRSATGRADNQRVRVFSAGLPSDASLRDQLLSVGGESDGASRQLARAVRETASSYVTDFEAMLVHRLDRYLRGGDHKPFQEAGVPAVRMTEVEENFRRQHQDIRTEAGIEYGDVTEHVDAAYIANVARVNIAAVAALSRAPAAPKVVRLDVRGLDEETTLLFVPDPNPAVSYEVLARPTDISTWTRRFPADRNGQVRIPLSKDHWLFALRAIGPAGHPSLAVFPLPLKAGDPWPAK